MKFLRRVFTIVLFSILINGCGKQKFTAYVPEVYGEEVWGFEKISEVPSLVDGLSLGMTEKQVLKALGITENDYQIVDKGDMFVRWEIDNFIWRDYPASLTLYFCPQKLKSGKKIGLFGIGVKVDEILLPKEGAAQWIRENYQLPEQYNSTSWELYGDSNISVRWYSTKVEKEIKNELDTIYSRIGLKNKKTEELMADWYSSQYLTFRVRTNDNDVGENIKNHTIIEETGFAAAIVEREYRENLVKMRWIFGIVLIIFILLIAIIFRRKNSRDKI